MKQQRMRLLRERHGITICELSKYCDISPQRLSQIELGKGNVTNHMKQLVETAFLRLIAAKQQDLTALRADFRKYRKKLLNYVDEEESK